MVDELLDLIVHRLFVDHTADVPDYRVVTIQERFIKQVIDQARSVDDVIKNPLLLKFFMKLTETNEARRCLHHLFRVKCERIDTSFFTVKNLQKTYLRYKELAQSASASQDTTGRKTSPIESTGHTPRGHNNESMSPAQIKTEREQAFYREMFIQLLDIVDAITGQMFERISVIPYSIR